jgi:enamine deaminase RidA (YjgF/YER057c/UK114 family)
MGNADQRVRDEARSLGYNFDGEIRVGGNYVSVVREGDLTFVSGQIPRVGSDVVVCGRVGETVALERGQHAAMVCALRALTLLQRELGSLEQVKQIMRVTVFTQCTADFAQQSEVADAASALLHRVLGDRGRHTRTSVGAFALPKNASVELDLVAYAI